MKRVLVANRGEIALRIIRACRVAGLRTVAVYSTADQGSPHAWAADEMVCIGPAAAAESYLNADIMLHVANARGCDAVHPGYGFLAENAEFAARCAEQGLTFVGPSADCIALMGDKAAARAKVQSLGVPVVPGSEGTYVDAAEAAAAVSEIGYPVLIKARFGGGGRGMRIAIDADQFAGRFAEARGEAEAAFGDGGIYLERFFPSVHHVEVQVFGDRHGNVRHLWERDCSVQRRHQKLVEESPSPVLDAETRQKMCAAAETVAADIGYFSAGTVEFIYDPTDRGFYFIEMNTRIQVEHPVTEVLTGVDLVVEQLAVAAGERLSFADHAPPARGHAIEFRINAEDPERGFIPCPGRVRRWRPPTGEGLRFDSHVFADYEIPPYYDSLLGKLIIRGSDRADAVDRAVRALYAFEVEGIQTTIGFHLRLLRHPDFLAGRVHTRWVEEEFGRRNGVERTAREILDI